MVRGTAMRLHIVIFLLFGHTVCARFPELACRDSCASNYTEKEWYQFWYGPLFDHLAELGSIPAGYLLTPPNPGSLEVNYWSTNDMLFDTNRRWQNPTEWTLDGSTSEWMGVFLASIDDRPADVACLNYALENYMAANGTYLYNVSLDPWTWEALFDNGTIQQNVTHSWSNSSDVFGLSYNYTWSANSFVVVDAKPAGDWFNMGALYLMRDNYVNNGLNEKANQYYFDATEGMFNAATVSMIVASNITTYMEILYADGSRSNGTSWSPRDDIPYIVAFVLMPLPQKADCLAAR